MASEAVVAEAPAEVKEKDKVASVAGHISVLTTGDHAMLRRMYLVDGPAVDGVVVKLLVYAGVDAREYEWDWAAWKLLVHSAALLSGTSKAEPHNPKNAFGSALHRAGVSEKRFLRLTATRGEALRDQVVLAVRILARAGVGPVNLRTLLHLIGRDSDRAERARLRLAQDYYAAVAAAG